MPEWTCCRCTFINHELMDNCEMCETPREAAEIQYLGEQPPRERATDDTPMDQTTQGPPTNVARAEQTAVMPKADDTQIDQTTPKPSADDLLSMDPEMVEHSQIDPTLQTGTEIEPAGLQTHDPSPTVSVSSLNGKPEVSNLPVPLAPVVLHDQESEDSPMSEPEHVDAAMCSTSPERALVEEESGWSFLSNEVRIVLIGKTGVGKSTTGNNILGNKTFKSSSSGASVTRKCQLGWASRFEKDIQIIDTPGLFDTGMSNEDVTREIVKCIGMTSPGPHAFVLVIRLDRFTAEEKATVDHFINVFGKEMLRYLIVLFTRMDDLKYDGTSLDEYVQNVPPDLKNLLKLCPNRHIGFDNRAGQEERDKDVQELLKMVDSMVHQNGGGHYTNEMYEEAEKIIAEQEEEQLKKTRKQMKSEMEKLRQEVEDELKRKEEEKLREVEQMKGKLSELGIKEDDEDWVEILGYPSMQPIEGDKVSFQPSLKLTENTQAVPITNGGLPPAASKVPNGDSNPPESCTKGKPEKKVDDGYSLAKAFPDPPSNGGGEALKKGVTFQTDSSNVSHSFNNGGEVNHSGERYDPPIQNSTESMSDHDAQVKELRDRAQKINVDHQRDRERMREEYYARQADAYERYNKKHMESRQRTREEMNNVNSSIFSRMYGAMKKFVKSITNPINRGLQSLFGRVQSRADDAHGQTIF